MYKDLSAKKRPQVVGTLKVIDIESNESEPPQKLCKIEGNVGSTKKVTVKKEVESGKGQPSEVEIVTPKLIKKALPSDIENTMYCWKCTSIFDSIHDLQKHKKTCYVSKWLLCTNANCKKDFSQKSLMLQHYRSIHEGILTSAILVKKHSHLRKFSRIMLK